MSQPRVQGSGAEPDMVPRAARPLVVLLITAMCASALFVWEPWPFTSFRLFSHLREERQVSLEATAIGRDGVEAGFPSARTYDSFRGWEFAMADFDDADTRRREELCRRWLAAADAAAPGSVEAITIHRRVRVLSERDEMRSADGTREPVYRCSASGVAVLG